MDQIEIANRLSQLEHYAAQIERTWDDVSFGDYLPSRKERLSQLATGVYNLQMRLFSGELYHPDAPALIETLEGYRSQIERWDGMFSGRDKVEACCVILRHWRGLILKPVSVGATRSNFPERDDWSSI
jgi:hypothetical protein